MGSEELKLGLLYQCAKAHKGETVEIVFTNYDANGIKKVETAIRTMYAELFGEELKIESMKREWDGALCVTLVKNED